MSVPERFDIPNAFWDPISFEAINRLSAEAEWVPLRISDLPAGSIEVRLWIESGQVGLEGFALRCDGALWSAFYTTNGYRVEPVSELEPVVGWGELWRTIEGLGILTLPDASTLQGDVGMVDGTSYVVEVSDGRRYRTYHYCNPNMDDCPEAGRIVEIERALRDGLRRKTVVS